MDGAPIFERVDHNAALVQVAPGGIDLPVRQEARNVKEWKDLPHDKVERVELYFLREHGYADRACIRIDRQPGADAMRFIQFKRDGITVEAGVTPRDMFSPAAGQRRTGTFAYVIGFWDPRNKECQLHEFNVRDGYVNHGSVMHPCWPKPIGFGLNPSVLGIAPGDVPAVPTF